MDPLWLSLSVPSATSAARTITRTAAAAATPFLAVLESAGQLLVDRGGSREIGDGPLRDIRSQADHLRVELTERIRQIATSLNLQFDGPLRVEISTEDGRLQLNGNDPAHVILEAALNADEPLVADARRLAALEWHLIDERELRLEIV